jgi:hypothetical protein
MKKLVFVFSIVMSVTVLAQQDFTLHQLTNTHQSTYVNVTNRPNSKVSVGLPVIGGIYFNTGNSGFTYNDIITVRQDDSLEINMDNVISVLKKRNYITTNFQIDYLSAGFYFKKKHYITLNVSEKINSRFTYPKDLIVLLWEGNGKSLLGKRADFDGIGYDFMQYREFAIGYNYELNEKWTVGGRLKYLKGITNIYTKTSNLGMTTDEITFDLTFDGEIDIYTSGVNELADTNYTFDFNQYMFKRNNSGLGVDLGASYQYSEKLKLFIDIIDLGYIKWNYDTRNFKKDSLSFSFTGIDIKDFLGTDDTTSSQISQTLADSINNTIQLKDYTGSYKTPLYTQFYLGGEYQLSQKTTLSGIGHFEFIHGRFRPSLTVGARFKVTHFLTVVTNYSAYNNSYLNLGVGFAANLGPIQWYFASNNVVGAIAPYLTKNAHFRTGINLLFGREKKQIITQSQLE